MKIITSHGEHLVNDSTGDEELSLARLQVIFASYAFKETRDGFYVAWKSTGDGVDRIVTSSLVELEAQLSGRAEHERGQITS